MKEDKEEEEEKEEEWSAWNMYGVMTHTHAHICTYIHSYLTFVS